MFLYYLTIDPAVLVVCSEVIDHFDPNYAAFYRYAYINPI